MGFGAGYLKTVPSPATIDIRDLYLNYGIYLDYRDGSWLFRIENSATKIKQDANHFEHISQSLQTGYSIRL